MADLVAEQIAALKDEDWGIREDAATALGGFQDPRGVRPLIEALRDSDKAVRDAATSALMTIGEPAVVEVAGCLRDQNLSVQEAAASILASIADDRVWEPLVSALLSSDWIVRMHAATALGRIQKGEAVETLALLLQDKVKAVRDEAVNAIKGIGETSVPILVESLNSQEWLIRLRAAEALGVVKSSTAVEPLVRLLLTDPDTAVRQDVTRALGEIGDPRVVEPLLQVMEDSRLRPLAIEALGKIKDRRAVGPLLKVLKELKSEDYDGRIPGCGDDRFEEDLVPMEASIKALARIGDPDVIPHLISALQSTLVRKEASEALVQFGEAIIPPLLDLLKKEKDDNIRFHAKESLARVGWKPKQIRL